MCIDVIGCIVVMDALMRSKQGNWVDCCLKNTSSLGVWDTLSSEEEQESEGKHEKTLKATGT